MTRALRSFPREPSTSLLFAQDDKVSLVFELPCEKVALDGNGICRSPRRNIFCLTSALRDPFLYLEAEALREVYRAKNTGPHESLSLWLFQSTTPVNLSEANDSREWPP